MKIVIINKSDSTGGAAVVSHRLLSALRKCGVDARMLVLEKKSDDECVSSFASGLKDKYEFLSERADIYLRNGFSRANLFKVDTAKWGRDVSAHPLVKESDVIVLNWINQGTLSLCGIEKLCATGKPVVWTMHDMWNCTGICHHAYECNGYHNDCGCCGYLSSSNKTDLSFHVHKLKEKLYSTDKIFFVAVSNWLAYRCRESSLMENQRMTVIHNAFPIDDFGWVRKIQGGLNIAGDKKVIVMGAARLDDAVKGFDHMIEAMNYIADNKTEMAKRLHLVLYGNIRNASLLDKIKIPHTYIGRVNGRDKLADIYSQADIVLSTSLYETLPGTLIEGQACGCVPVTFGNGGQTDIIEHKRTGYIAEYRSAESIAEGIEWAVNADIDRKMLHEEVRSKFSSEIIANLYISLFNDLLNK